MKRLLTAISALAVLSAPVLTLAQEHHEEGGHQGGHPSGAAPHGAPPQGQAQPQFHGPQGGPPRGPQGGAQPQFRGAPLQPQGNARPAFQGQPQFRGPPQGGQAQFQGRSGFQGRQGGVPAAGFRAQSVPAGARPGARPGGVPFAFGGRSFFRYRAEPYRFPGGYGGWGNHFWRRGEFLPAVFFLPNYFISDYWNFGLWAPDYGYQWVRVGADALLVNMATGEVVDAVPGVYYW